MTPTTMRAWRTHEYGQPGTALQLDEVDVPEPGDGEVRVRAPASRSTSTTSSASPAAT